MADGTGAALSEASVWKAAVFGAAALLFDNDGVLVDSKAAGEAAWREWALEHNLELTAVLAGIHGRRSVETVGLFVPADQVAAATAHIDALELGTAHRTRPLAGATEMFGQVPDDARAVVTSAPRALGLARLTAAGIPVPSVVVTAEDVAAGKPAPDPYLLAAARLGVKATQCVVFEDSPNGIAAALAAGAGTVVGVGPSALGQGCDVVIPDLSAARWTGAGVEIARTIERGGRRRDASGEPRLLWQNGERDDIGS
jgi:sugar-phosphatase